MTNSTGLQEYALAIYSPTHVEMPPVVYDLAGNSIDIGSAEDNQIVLNAPGVEAYHLAIRQMDSKLCALVDLNIARRYGEAIWLEKRPEDTLFCPIHGQIMDVSDLENCPMCSGKTRSLWLLRPLQSGDDFSIGKEFKATVLSQGNAKSRRGLGANSTAAPWPTVQWLEHSRKMLIGANEQIREQDTYPVFDSNLWVWHPPQSPIPIFMHQRANRFVTNHANSNPGREVGGLLLGHVFGNSDEGIVYPVVSDAIAARFAEEMRGHLTFTHKTWLDLTQQREENHPDKQVVGWYHTHPGLGIFLSDWDLMIHRNFFREIWQVALVIDPHESKAGFFVWSKGDVLDPQHPYELFTTADIDESIVNQSKPRIRIKLGTYVP